MANPSQVKRYTERTKTRFDHQWEICHGKKGELYHRTNAAWRTSSALSA